MDVSVNPLQLFTATPFTPARLYTPPAHLILNESMSLLSTKLICESTLGLPTELLRSQLGRPTTYGTWPFHDIVITNKNASLDEES